MSGKKYIYVVGHANELIQRGYHCIETGFNAKSQKFYWVFSWAEIQPYYKERQKG